MVELIDTHCHLSFAPLSTDLDGVINRAAKAGVSRIVVPAYDLVSWQQIAQLCSLRAGVLPAFGLHPWQADQELDLQHLHDLLVAHRAVAVGEIGLDYKIDSPDRQRQRSVLIAQLQLAVDLGLPVLLHCRGAFDDLIELVQPFLPRLKGVVHAYSRGPELARRLLELGLYLGFGGAITRPRARQARRSAELVPLERIVLETDAPSIGLAGVPPEQTEPWHVVEVARALAEIKGIKLAEICEWTTRNADVIFAG